ncbi:putative ATP-dependent zinc protease [Vibrio ulleungensis]|uniref:ATP-dependent zinc protease n=1 Tax=Vibrio ulleungensis TaxID=2807619 RepID=A0ABS2HKT0_9VIBR|nr:RimK/LysX family protein [Vibrio ulleungensis]MBM7037659.1 ATP-dependent zinc protease [Vibrio ulleungensis]
MTTYSRSLLLCASLLTAQWVTSSAVLAANSSDLSGYSTANPAYHIDDKVVLGRLESVYLSGIDAMSDFPLIGKIDTGADTTSMHADNIEVYSTNPKYKGLKNVELMQTIVDEFGGPASNWWLESFDTPERDIQGVVKFHLTHPTTGEKLELERPLARTSVIRSRTSSTPIYRPVISIPLRIADTTVTTDVNLTDRSHFSAPVLIGKTFLKQHAWVAAGYDYLQEQPKAIVMGKKETLNIGESELAVSYSFVNRYSNMHATNINVDEQAGTVSFDTIGINDKSTNLTLPLIRMLSVSGVKRPLVYVPVSKGEFDTHILVYLRDRSSLSTQLRLGTESQSRHFVVHTRKENLLKSEPKTFEQWMERDEPIVVSTEEHLKLDGYSVMAYPSTAVITPVLFVDDYSIKKGKEGDEITFKMPNGTRSPQQVTKPIVKEIKVGSRTRPVVKGVVSANGEERPVQFALDKADEGEESYLAFGASASRDGVLVNARSRNLLSPEPIYVAGYIENATIENLTFPVKLDTGADVSAINASNIERFKEAGIDMVRFDYNNQQGQQQTFERAVVDVMRIRAKAGEEPEERPVVEMKVSLGDISETIRVNLQDRSRFEYSMILGKNFLEHGVIVSSDKQFIKTTNED